MKAHLPDIILLVAGLFFMVFLLYLGAISESWVALPCYLGAAVVYTGWHRALINWGWRLAGKDPGDHDFHFPG